MASYDESSKGPLTSPSALSHLSRRLEIPRADSPGPGSDFATGYSLGLIGGVRSWVSLLESRNWNSAKERQMMGSRQTNRDSQHGSERGSDSSEEDSDERSPPRGRSGNVQMDQASRDEKAVDAQIDALMSENSKASGA